MDTLDAIEEVLEIMKSNTNSINNLSSAAMKNSKSIEVLVREIETLIHLTKSLGERVRKLENKG